MMDSLWVTNVEGFDLSHFHFSWSCFAHARTNARHNDDSHDLPTINHLNSFFELLRITEHERQTYVQTLHVTGRIPFNHIKNQVLRYQDTEISGLYADTCIAFQHLNNSTHLCRIGEEANGLL